MKRIILTVTNDLNYDQRMIRICSTLAHAGYEVCLVGRLRRHSAALSKQVYRQERLSCCFDRGIFFYVEIQLRLFYFLLTNRFDLVCGVDLDTILPCYLASRLRCKPCLYDAHEYYVESPELIHRPAVRRVWEALGNWVVPRVDYRITVGRELAVVMENQYGKPFAVIRNLPKRQENISAQPFGQQPIILYQGVLNVGRGLEEAIDALALLPSGQLWLAGEGDLSGTLRQKVTDLQLEDRVRFLGWLAPEELRRVTLQATIGLNLLARMGLNYYYSLANKALDYIQAGVPCITMDFPEYRNLQETYEVFHLVEELTVEQVSRAMRQLLDDHSYRRFLRENCLKAAQELVWEEESKVLRRLLTEILTSETIHHRR